MDFGPDIDPRQAFALQRKFESRGPLVNSEFYPAWFDLWGQHHNPRPGLEVAKALYKILAINGSSVNFYMMHGGTNFAFEAGAGAGGTGGGRFYADTTSYDYDAPISEWGDLRSGLNGRSFVPYHLT